ncbi:MAG: LysM peptidoglycan-binding domain-containing protein [Spirochaetia bacterium]
MDSKKIGIRVADGTIYSVLDEDEHSTKRVILTTARDDQAEIHAEIYRGTGEEMVNPVRIGQLKLGDLNPKKKGEPELELILGTDPFGKLTARLLDPEKNNEEFLSVDLNEIDTESDDLSEDYSVPDVDLSPTEPFEPQIPVSEYEGPEENEPAEEKKGSKWLVALFVFIGLAVIAGLVFLIFTLLKQQENNLEAGDAQNPSVAAESDSTVAPQEESSEPAGMESKTVPEPEVEEPDSRKAAETPGAVSAQNGKKGGVWYSIAWGDTLWDLSNSFYRTPWLYNQIAAENNIEDPDFIFAGNRIYIPEVTK